MSCPSGGIGRHKGLEQFEPSGGNARSEARQSRRKPWMLWHPSQRRAKPKPALRLGRCREQTAGTYGCKAMVKACSRPRTAHVLAAKAEVVRKSLAERRAGSIPASGTNIGPVPFRGGGFFSSSVAASDRCRYHAVGLVPLEHQSRFFDAHEVASGIHLRG